MEKAVGNRNQRKDVENDEKQTECAGSAVLLDGEISKYAVYFTRSCTGMYVIT